MVAGLNWIDRPRQIFSLRHQSIPMLLARRGLSRAVHARRQRPQCSSSRVWQSNGQQHGGGVVVVVPPVIGSQIQIRGKKTKTVVSLDDLPQGVIRSEPPIPSLSDEPPASPAYPTVVLQARRNMQKFENCVLLTRVGGFYELYFEHADEYGPLLNLKVAQKKTAAGLVPMVIIFPFPLLIPFHSIPFPFYPGPKVVRF